ncbi:MAG: FtsW/RodA/SpoVE family cell cycle protein, partial [Lachnospiraceae bacterium]|nr:FtsW/RodA/SpoVE family cell cycle protein [Lachnospiraceae bacterium]
YAIGSGGLFGRGLGESIQKMGFLPESHNDMIFSVICEELGLFGAIATIALFVMLLLRFRYIANNAPDSFGGLLCTGVITHIAIQFIINVGVVTNTIPNTGVTLPFISYGGTSLVFLLIEVGIVLGVSRQMRPVE